MKTNNLLFVAVLIIPAGSWGAVSLCRPPQEVKISVDGRCFESGGIPMNMEAGQEGLTETCMSDIRVRRACGDEGEVAQVHAFSNWLDAVKTFESRCAAQGGTFRYAQPDFEEPARATFCGAAVPMQGSSMFEEALCNYRSTCPDVDVRCDFHC